MALDRTARDKKSATVVRSEVELEIDQGRSRPRSSTRYQSYICSRDAMIRVCT